MGIETRRGSRDHTSDADAETMPGAVAFRVDVAMEHGGAMRVRPVGEVDIATVGRVRARIDEAMAAGAGRVILDLRTTTFLDSAGLHLALDTVESAARNGTEFTIIAGPHAVQRTFDVAGLRAQLPFVEAEELQAFRA
jgi:anti-anti-sigma factor